MQLRAGFVDGLAVYVDEGERTRTIADLRSNTPIKDFAQVNMGEQAAPWRAHHQLEALQPATEYIVHGGSHTNQWASAHVSFTTDQLKALDPKQVPYQRYDEKADDDRDVVVTEAQFRADTCAEEQRRTGPASELSTHCGPGHDGTDDLGFYDCAT